ncbi:hypothetical protein B0H17DRAFT_721077 [Mycena rosella]|uniref:DUF6533 domain-containing protein n=1 Tax=Mycena rosella TaxID=1033263 RepID=A0AAD7F9V0_MYCRO|nr:hypothetical protein B0H17DRAFT_721077 [Mycena rosella]
MRPQGPSPPSEPITPDVIILGEDLLAFKMYFAGCFTLLFFDFFLTLGDEVDYVWKARKTPMFYIFLMNRYCPMAFCIITFIYFSILELRSNCNRFAIVEWLQTLLIVVPAEVVLILRIYALTKRNSYLSGFLVSLILVECVIVFYAMSLPGTNNALTLPHVPIDPFHVCILYSDPKMDTAYLSTSIAFDCIVFTITIAATVNNSVHRSHPSILETIRWDGTLYFCVILSGNVVWMALAVNGRPGLKLMNAQPSMYLTSVMINRLTLSIRKAALDAQTTTTVIDWPGDIFPPNPTHDISAFRCVSTLH